MTSSVFLGIYLKSDTNGQHSIRLYGKGYDFNFAIINCTDLDSNISTIYDVYFK